MANFILTLVIAFSVGLLMQTFTLNQAAHLNAQTMSKSLRFTMRLVVAFWLISFCSLSNAASGTVILAKGVVTATDTAKASRVLGRGAAIDEGDVINTANKSFAVIRMVDNTKLTLKPNTTIAIGAFNDKEGEEEACINLVKGGLRTVTGLIGQRKPDSFNVDTPIASIGIRGTDFITRICSGTECLEDEQDLSFGDEPAVDATSVAEGINQSLPEGLYGSCETGAIVMSQCAGQAEKFEVGKCRVAQPADCIQVELGAGKAGYSSAPVVASAQTAPSAGVTALPKVPVMLERDPHFALSDLSDADLDRVDRFPDNFSPEGQCSIVGG